MADIFRLEAAQQKRTKKSDDNNQSNPLQRSVNAQIREIEKTSLRKRQLGLRADFGILAFLGIQALGRAGKALQSRFQEAKDSAKGLTELAAKNLK